MITDNFNIKEHCTPILNRVLCEVFKESEEYFAGLKKVETQQEIEPYVFVHAVGTGCTSVKEGMYALLRNDISPVCFKLGEKRYTVLYESDLTTTISPELKEFMTNERISQTTRNGLDIN